MFQGVSSDDHCLGNFWYPSATKYISSFVNKGFLSVILPKQRFSSMIFHTSVTFHMKFKLFIRSSIRLYWLCRIVHLSCIDYSIFTAACCFVLERSVAKIWNLEFTRLIAGTRVGFAPAPFSFSGGFAPASNLWYYYVVLNAFWLVWIEFTSVKWSFWGSWEYTRHQQRNWRHHFSWALTSTPKTHKKKKRKSHAVSLARAGLFETFSVEANTSPIPSTCTQTQTKERVNPRRSVNNAM